MYVHGDNIRSKQSNGDKYKDADSQKYLKEIEERYQIWKKANLELRGPGSKTHKEDHKIIAARVELLNEYKDFVDQQHYAEHFDSRSNLQSSVLEEFMYYLFRDLVADISADALVGKCHSLKDFFFRPSTFKEMLTKPYLLVETKDHDFAIGAHIHAVLSCKGSEKNESHGWDVPAVGIECKTYLDKTMLQDVATAAAVIRQRNPNAMYIVVAEWLKLTEKVNLHKTGVDQIYVLRKQKNTDREYRYAKDYIKNPIYADVASDLFEMIRKHLTFDWEGSIASGLERGRLL
jgi:hypothetical protein